MVAHADCYDASVIERLDRTDAIYGRSTVYLHAVLTFEGALSLRVARNGVMAWRQSGWSKSHGHEAVDQP